MSTIAYKSGKIAYDSRLTRGTGDIVTDHADKHRYVDPGINFFLVGLPAEADLLISAYLEGELSAKRKLYCEALVMDQGKLFHIRVDESGYLEKTPLLAEEPTAIGSGCDFAIGAMRHGAGARKAVEIAKLCASNTGGLIRMW